MTVLPYICNCKTGFVSNCLKAFKLQMVVQAPMSATTPPTITWGPWIRDPQYENMLSQKFREDTPQQQEVVMEQK